MSVLTATLSHGVRQWDRKAETPRLFRPDLGLPVTVFFKFVLELY